MSLRCGQWQIAFQIERVTSALNGTSMLIVLRENREKYITILDISENYYDSEMVLNGQF